MAGLVYSEAPGGRTGVVRGPWWQDWCTQRPLVAGLVMSEAPGGRAASD